MDEKYTGRQIAIFTDIHGLVEPLEAALKDIEERGITEIFSLGDNIGVGPESGKVIDLLDAYGVKSVAGNSENYLTLGYEPFASYFDRDKEKKYDWTFSQLDERQVGIIKMYPSFYELSVGGKNIALCHFANDVRCDFDLHSTWSYQRNFNSGYSYKQFDYTNSDDQKNEIDEMIDSYGENNPFMKGYVSAKKEPLFNGKKVDNYDAVFQGHVHFGLYEKGKNTEFYTVRGLGIAYGKNQSDDHAYYIILKEKNNNQGFDVEEILVKFDRDKMECSIENSNGNMSEITRFTSKR